MSSLKRLSKEFETLTDSPIPGVTARPVDPSNLRQWKFSILGPRGCPYEYGVFTGFLHFPVEYPYQPPKMVFDPPITHPNVYGSGARKGEVCISILHAGTDATGYERPEERWSPAHSSSTILLSVLSMLGDINAESPANVDAAKLYLSQPSTLREVVRGEVERSLHLGPAIARLGLTKEAKLASERAGAEARIGGGGGGGGRVSSSGSVSSSSSASSSASFSSMR